MMQVFKFWRLIATTAVVAIACSEAKGGGLTAYVAQSAGTFSGGKACNGQQAESIAAFNSGAEAAGSTYYFCGTITTTVKINGSGNSGNVITFLWDTGARISQPVAQAINLNGSSAYLLFDGGIPCGPGTTCDTVEAANNTGYAMGQAGIIEATANGSLLANQNPTSQAFYRCNGCHDIEIRNLIIRNLYVHSSMSDSTNNADSGPFVFQCASGSATACAGGTLSIHDSTIHDNGNALSLEHFPSSPVTLNVYNLDCYHNNWCVELSGSGQRTLNLHDNHFHDASNWDTTLDTFHHNGLHIYMVTGSDSLGINIYNNLSDGNWGPCCSTTTMLFTDTIGYATPANLNVYNNVAIQFAGNRAPAWEFAATGGVFVNNTAIGVAATTQNVTPINLAGTGITFENNAIQGYGQYVVIASAATFTAFDYNQYGPVGISGNWAWFYEGAGANGFAAWQKACSCDAHAAYSPSLGLSLTGALQAGSALIGAGANLTSLGITALDSDTSDGDTQTPAPRPATGAWDAGAYRVRPSPPTSVTASPH